MIFIDEFVNAGLNAKTGVLLKDFLSLKIGGEAEYFIEAKSVYDIQKAIEISKRLNLRYFVIGNGSNTLALDYGVEGVIIHLGKDFSKFELLDDNVIMAQAGALLKDVCMFARDNGLSGMEALYGIPASIGGAVYMNAGAYSGEMKHVVANVEFIDDNNDIKTFSNTESEFAYRHSYYMFNKSVVTTAYFKLHPAKKEDITERMEDYMHRRVSKQPLEWPSAGSTFKRPEFNYASALIDQCGLKGYNINGIEVSSKHAGFLINVNSGNSDDFINLVRHIQSVVYTKTGFELETEIQFLK